MLTSVTLIEEICKIHPHTIDEFKQAVPILVRRLKTLATTSSFLPELDVSGVTDPFLQVKILKLLRTLGIDDVEASESMNDVLAQVATNTDSTKNAGNAILYETVLTVMDIESDSDLRLMAINILGKFLGNKDNNTRYVALTTLHRAVNIDLPAVQRHRDTILECLHDVDVSICRRALELTYALIDGENVRILMRELLAFLEVTQDPEVKADMAVQLCIAAEKFAPNRRWHIDTVVRVMRLAGNHVHEDIVSSLTRLIANSNELHLYSVSKLYQALKSDLTQESLVLVGVWILGELSNVLTESNPISEDGESQQKVTCSEILDLMEQIYSARQNYPNTSVQQYLATSLAKLSVRFTNEPDAESLKQRITQLLRKLGQSNDVEVQQRALEYIELLKINPMYLAILEPMPSPKLSENSKLTARGQKSHRSSRNVNGSSTRTKKAAQQNLLLDLMMGEEPSDSANGASSSGQAAGSSLDPLDGLFGSGSGPSSSSKPRNDSIMDLLGDLDLGQQPSTSSPPLPTSASPQTSPNASSPQNDIFASFGTPESTPISQEYNVFENDGLKITMTPSKDAANPNVTNFETNFTTTNGSEATDLMLQIAVPKVILFNLVNLNYTNNYLVSKNSNVTPFFYLGTNWR
jgi:AP-1 complex subunit gamma-1